jgi:hypothetical protein
MEMTRTEHSTTDQPQTERNTVLGLFDDTIDAEHALVALRRAENPAEQVSVLVRDRATDAAGGPERQGEVARAVVANALNAVSGWLLGLAALVVPENGTYLVAGPIGAALAGVRTIEEHQRQRARDEGVEEPKPLGDLRIDGLKHMLTEFGFRPDEAAYLQNRLAAGSALIAVTTSNADQLQATRRLFADHSAVHIGQAQTRELIVTEAEGLLSVEPEAAVSGDVVVADAVAPLLRLCNANVFGITPPATCGAHVIDANGEEVGEIEDILATGTSGDAGPAPIPRYIVIGFGGLLGILRHRSAVPADHVDLSVTPVRLTVSKEIVRRAPSYDSDVPFSRREEMAINAYFGTTPYWLGESR